jgi:hypothetical protein
VFYEVEPPFVLLYAGLLMDGERCGAIFCTANVTQQLLLRALAIDHPAALVPMHLHCVGRVHHCAWEQRVDFDALLHHMVLFSMRSYDELHV